MKMLFRKTILVALIAVLGAAALPFASVSAAGDDVRNLSVPQGQVSNEKLERVWARQLATYERIGQGFEREDAFMEKAQKLIDRAQEKGKDVSAVQAVLDAFEAALQDAQPIYESAEGIVNLHQGFDGNGNVTDPARAQETVGAMRNKLKEIKAAMAGTGKALHEAIRVFRAANPHPQPTSTSTGG